MDLSKITTKELLEELCRRNALPCKCRRWKTYPHYAGGLGCHGCRKPCAQCTCG